MAQTLRRRMERFKLEAALAEEAYDDSQMESEPLSDSRDPLNHFRSNGERTGAVRRQAAAV